MVSSMILPFILGFLSRDTVSEPIAQTSAAFFNNQATASSAIAGKVPLLAASSPVSAVPMYLKKLHVRYLLCTKWLLLTL